MALVLKVAAAVLALIGSVTLYWGTNPSLLSLGNTVMIVGAVIAAAGIVLFGLAAVLGQLGVVADKLDALRTGLPAGMAAGDTMEGPAGLAPAAEAPLVAMPATAPAVAPVAPVVLDRLEEALMAPPPPPPPPPAAAPTVPTPPSRQSFGLPPLAGQASFAAAAGLAASATSASAGARSAEKPPEPAVAPPVAVPVAEDLDDDKAFAGDDKRFAGDDKAFTGDDQPWTGDEKAFAPARPDADLIHALEDMRAELKAAEADLAPSAAAPGDEPTDPMASLERLLLGASAGDARAPAEPEPIASALHRAEPDDGDAPLPVETEKAFEPRRDIDPPRDATAAVPDLAPIPDADDFMARLRETISRPVAAPDLAVPLPPEPAPDRQEPPPLSIEEELERALHASLAESALVAAPPPVIEPPPVPAPSPVMPLPAPVVEAPRRPEPPRLELIRPDPAAASAAAPREDGMAALARDFPELNDLLAPAKPSADPATSLMDDLKDIFEPQSKVAPRQEPVLAAPAPPPMPPLLREGVIAGISFRLYGDGSIEADLPEGTSRFASLKDFRAHVGG
ncbi:MAG: hypothetical protein Q8O26_05680 [Phreatobacter sp.]|uniref:hypothetical protein n=1 Tax=Phreatobacter sp. TaxID=1966341 RepID=UPI00273624B0|nr:hypothetical protein [Phreatobacter sp.]MDP2801357.1 hypothetical protein [Phreatobacter sp.]